MLNIQTIATLPATFSALEPLVGAVFALSLAYLALPNLRYRDQINRMAAKALRGLDDLNPSEELCKKFYSRLVRLSDSLATEKQKQRFEKNGKDIPNSEDSNPYEWLFPLVKEDQISRDATITLLIAFTCFILLTLGVIENGNIFNLATTLKDAPSGLIATIFIAITICSFIPIISLWIGRKWVRWARSQIYYFESECLKDFKAAQITAEIPSNPPQKAASNAEIEKIIETVMRKMENKHKNDTAEKP